MSTGSFTQGIGLALLCLSWFWKCLLWSPTKFWNAVFKMSIIWVAQEGWRKDLISFNLPQLEAGKRNKWCCFLMWKCFVSAINLTPKLYLFLLSTLPPPPCQINTIVHFDFYVKAICVFKREHSARHTEAAKQADILVGILPVIKRTELWWLDALILITSAAAVWA